jgi:GST-like protein
MIDVHLSDTPNGMKVKVFLEETNIPHRALRVSLSRGEQYKPDFQAMSPNNKIPAIVDHAPTDGGASLAMFESGAILLYLAQKHDVLMPRGERTRLELMQWLFWQVGGLGPMGGQIGHFNVHAPERVPYAIARYTREIKRCFTVLDRRLADRAYIVDDYSIADIACYPWIVPHKGFGVGLDAFPNLKRWFDAISMRPAVQRAYDGVEDAYSAPLSAEARKILFQHDAQV